MDVLRLNALVYALRRAKHLVYRPPDGPTCSGASSRKRIASVQFDNGFHRTLDQIRGIAESRGHNRLRPAIPLRRGSSWARAMAGTASYIAAVKIDEVHRGPGSEGAEREPFGGIVPADTFHLSTLQHGFLELLLPDNGERRERQDLPVQVGSRPFNLRGNQRTQGEYSSQESRIAFGQGWRVLHASDYREPSPTNPWADDDADH